MCWRVDVSCRQLEGGVVLMRVSSQSSSDELFGVAFGQLLILPAMSDITRVIVRGCHRGDIG